MPYVRLPNGSFYEFADTMSPLDAQREAYKLHPEAFGVSAPAAPTAQPKGGVTGAFGLGLESLLSSGRTAFGAITDPEEAARAALVRQQQLGEKYAEPTSLERVKQAYEQDGLLSAAKEVGSQIPKALAEQAPNLAATLGGARAGATLGSFAGPVGTVVGGVAGAALPSLVQQFGSNIERQAAEQQRAGQPIEIDRGAAAMGAVPQAALDVAGSFIPLGGRLVSKLTGIPEAALFKVGGTKLAEERLASTLLKGTAVGALAEIPTEVAQQMIERAQAGLSLTDRDALNEYGQTAYQVGLLGPIGAAGRLAERGAAREEVATKKREEEQAAAQAAEAAKNTPEALMQLDADYRAAQQQKDALDAKVKSLEPKKGATDEDKAAYQAAKDERGAFIRDTYKPLRMEFDQRKDAIGQMYETRQAETEAGTAEQPTAVAPVPSEAPKLDVQTLMLEQDKLRNQLSDVETQLGKAAPEQFDALNEQRQQLQRRIDARAALIEERGGAAIPQEEFQQATAAKMQAYNQRLDKLNASYASALENKDYDEAAKIKDELLALKKEREDFTNKTSQQMQALQEKQTGLEKRGQTRELFGEMPEQPKEKGIKYTNIKGEELKPADVAESIADVFQLPRPTLRQKQAQQATTKKAEAENALATAVKSGNQVQIDAALKEVNKYEAQESRLSQPFQKGTILDIFDPANILQEAVSRQDWQTVMDYTKARDESKAADLEAKSKEREALTKALDERLGLGGAGLTKAGQPLRNVERTQRSFEEIATELAKRGDKWAKGLMEQYRLLRTGAFPDPEMQRRFDQSADAYAQDYVMREIERLQEKVTKKQGNAKKSLLQQITDLAQEEALLVDAINTGIAKPTLREKVAALQAKLGEGEAPGERQMDAGERAAVNRRLTKVREEYASIVNKITPVKDQILSLYSKLYNFRPLETKAAEREQKQALLEGPVKAIAEKRKELTNDLKTAQAMGDKEAEAEAKKKLGQLSLMTREQKRAKRMESGDVKYEALKSEKLDEMAYGFGTQTEGFSNALQEAKRRLDKLVDRYGADDAMVKAFKADTKESLIEVAIREGRKTPEFKELRKEQIEKFQEALAQSKQEVPSKRVKAPETRKVTRYAREERTGSPESRAATESRQESASKRAAPSQVREGMRGGEKKRNLRGIEVESLALMPEYVGMLERGDLQGVLRYLSKDKKVDEFSRAVAGRLEPFLDVTKVKVVNRLTVNPDGTGPEVLGAATSKLIELSRNGGLSVETLLHEATHAAAERVVQLSKDRPDLLTREQKLAINELKAIHATIQRDAGITSKNAKGSLSEFVAEVMSNRNLQKQLAMRKWRMSDMWAGIKSVIMRMLGLDKVETMFGASVVSIEQLFIPASTGMKAVEGRVTRDLSAKDVAALHTGSNSMKQFADQFGDRIKQKDRTPEDVERIATEFMKDMADNPEKYLSLPTKDSLDYKAMATMSDGQMYDKNNPLHYLEAEPATFAALEALKNPDLRAREAEEISRQRQKDFASLANYFDDNYQNFTAAEVALVMKAAAKYAVLSGKDGRLRLAEIAANNRHNIAVVGKEGADAIIEQLRAGKGLKQAFLDGLQKVADENAKNNERRNGWKKFDQVTDKAHKLSGLYTKEELDEAFGQTGYSGTEFADDDEMIETLIADGFLEDRRSKLGGASKLEEAAADLNAGCAGTSWCTGASVSTARGQIEGGDFYVYYKDGKPEVAVRMNGQDSIGEVRGNTPQQALNSEQQKIAETFLRSNNFKGSDVYLKELSKREMLRKIFSDKNFDDYAALSGFGRLVSFGNFNEHSIDSLLDFNHLGGYRRQSPSEEVRNQLRARMSDILKNAYADNYFIGADVTLRAGSETRIEIDGKEFVVDPATVKTAAKITASGGYKYAPIELPLLESVGNLWVHGGSTVIAPRLKNADEISGFTSDSKDTFIRVNSDAVIGDIEAFGSDKGTVVLEGGKTISRARRPHNGSNLVLQDAKFVQVVEVEASKLYREIQNVLRTHLRHVFKDEAPNAPATSLMTAQLNELDKTQAKAFIKGMNDIAEVLDLRTKFTSLDEFILDNTPRDYVDEFMDSYAGTLDTAELLKLGKKINDANFKDVSLLPTELGEVIAPNKLADTPYGQEFTEEPETRRFAKADYGVREDGKNGFQFFRKKAKTDSVVAQEPGIVDKVLGNIMGLAGRVQFIDQYAALEAGLKQGLSKGVISSLEATNANYLIRFGQQRSQFAGQFMTNGPVKLELTKKPGGVESIYRSTKGTNMMDVAEALNKAGIADDVEQENMFTVYLAGERAKQVGWEKLNFSSPQKAKAEYDSIVDKLRNNKRADDAFKEAKRLYQKYNAGLLDFLVETGVLPESKAAELKSITYVPFYRINDNGEVQLMIDKETPVRISNIKDEPQLQSLVGGNTAILPVFTSAAQNTFMITGMGLRNQAVKETAFVLKKLGIASVLTQGKGPTGKDTVRFKKNGKDYYALIDTDMYGIPADLIVKGMEGIKTTLPAAIKMLGVPANVLRSFVVRNPAYAVRQVIRDPLNAWMTTGTDATPVLSSMKELASMVAGRSEAERKLMETGAISSNIYSGDEQDMGKFIKDIASGRSGWDKLVGKLDTLALQGDAATRAVIYKDSLDKGMSEQEALLRTLESMNFSRRGVSPSMQALSVMIPFFNAQIQGLDVIYRAMKGDMPFNEQLRIREKMVQRGLMMAAGTLAYAAYMGDDEAYKRAKPEERYGNWFVYLPGVSEPVRVPIPFEMGFLFKALPEAVYNMAAQDEKSEKAMKGLFRLAQQTNPFSLPQAVKPLTEVVLGKSFYGGDIESLREKEQLATDRYRESTTEVAKLIGSVTGMVGLSPISVDYLIRGYTGGLGIALIQMANPLLASDTKRSIAEPSMKPSKAPFIGGLFQPVEGRGTLDEAYDRMLEIRQVKGTYNKLVEEGKRAEAMAFAQEYSNKLAAMSLSGSVQKQLGEMAKMERQIRAAPGMTTEQKDARLAQIDKAKMAIARQFLAVTDRTTRQ